MASSGSSTPAGRKRAAKTATRRRSAGTHKPAKRKAPSKPRAQAAKPKPKPTATKPKPPAKPKRAKPKTSRPKRHTSSRAQLVPRALTIALVVGAIALGLAAAYWYWFRDSSFVAIEKVTVEGIEGPETDQVSTALTKSAERMTTLNVDESALAAAVSRYPTVVAIETETDFPHGITVQVTGRPPVLSVSDGGQAVPVAGDGTLLRGVAAEGLPAIQVDSVPVKGKLEGEPLALAQVAGAAPSELRPMIEGLVIAAGEGIEVTLKGGIPVKFGDPDALEEKWTAVTAVLASPQVKTLTHLDVRVPKRPSIGGAAPAPKPE